MRIDIYNMAHRMGVILDKEKDALSERHAREMEYREMVAELEDLRKKMALDQERRDEGGRIAREEEEISKEAARIANEEAEREVKRREAEQRMADLEKKRAKLQQENAPPQAPTKPPPDEGPSIRPQDPYGPPPRRPDYDSHRGNTAPAAGLDYLLRRQSPQPRSGSGPVITIGSDNVTGNYISNVGNTTTTYVNGGPSYGRSQGYGRW